jgi:2,4-dienoyl-CoA reductase-like NADH-dependent reductase (Old Yellow Enzyme family)
VSTRDSAGSNGGGPIFEPFTINGVEFKNRVIRSSIGGRLAYYDGSVNPAWAHFERRFAEHGVAAVVSATFTVDDHRWAPIEYPKISQDRFIKPISEGVRQVQALGCRYVLQIGDPGYHTQAGLFSERQDQLSASGGFDLVYGYRSVRSPMTIGEIEATVANFAQAARRVKEAGCDGIEVTASKGYLIHQFLNPGINRRRDRYGGSAEKRFRFLRDIVVAIREVVGLDFLFGVRLSARDYNYLPVNLKWPPTWPLRHYWFGNDLPQTLKYAGQLKSLGVDYLHVSNGFGFPNPKETPGRFPMQEVRLFYNSLRHLSAKSRARSTVMNLVPLRALERVGNIGWGYRRGINLGDAAVFRREVGLPVIANGGFQQRSLIEAALASGSCDLVAMARPLLANVDLIEQFRAGKDMPERPCTFCNRCAIRTTIAPLGCYEPKRFGSQEEMEQQILAWSAPSG